MISACTHRIIPWPGNTISQENPFFLWDIPSLRCRLHCFSLMPAKNKEEIPTYKGKFQYYIYNKLLLFLVLHQGEHQLDLWVIPCILTYPGFWSSSACEVNCDICQTQGFRDVLIEDTCWFTGASLLIHNDNRFYLEGFLLPLFIEYFRSGTLLCSVVLYCCL